MDKCWFVLRQTHFLAPEYTQPSMARGEATGSLLLGHLVPSLKQLDQVINSEEQLPFPRDMRIEQTTLTDFHWEAAVDTGLTTEANANVPIAAAAGLTVQGGIRAQFEKTVEDSWQFDQLDAQIIRPTRSYIKHCLKLPQVTEHIERVKTLGFCKLFMISGLMIARGCARDQTASSGKSTELNPGLNMADVVGADIKLGVSHSSRRTISSRHANDFIWAVRLTELSKTAFRPEFEHKTYTAGATFGSKNSPPNINELAEKLEIRPFDAFEVESPGMDEEIYLIVPSVTAHLD